MKILLNEAEQRLTRFIARQRGERHVKAGAVPTIYKGTDRIEADIESLGVEIAFCKMHNIYLYLEHIPDEGKDAVLQDGRTVDVKVTEYKSGKLLVKVLDRHKNGLPDMYALMIGKFPEYEFAGWISSREVIQEDQIDNTLPHPAYIAHQHELRK
jgi:hypothetical protein